MFSIRRAAFGLLILLIFAIGGGFAVALLWALGEPPPWPLFTDNIAASGPGTAVTEMEQALLDHINGATTSIDLAIYDFNRVSVREALIAAHTRGVIVRVVTDDDAYENPSYHPFYMALETVGIPVVNDSRSSIMHNKFYVVDGEIVWTGSTNMTDNGFTFNHENTVVFTSTLLSDIYTIEFEEMFSDGRFGTAKTDNVTHTLTANGVPVQIYFSPSDGAMDEVMAAVSTADSTIELGIFFFTDTALRDVMVERMQTGVTVTGVCDALGAANAYSQDEILCAAGAALKIEDFGGKLHHKAMVIDAGGSDPIVITGSMNWTGAGGDANDENTLIIHDANLAAAYQSAIMELYNALDADTLCLAGVEGNAVFLPILSKPESLSSTPEPTPPPGNADVRLQRIVYNPDGDDVIGEYVQLVNVGSNTQSIMNWTLQDESNHVYTFPPVVLAAGATMRVWTKTGVNTSTDLYWGSGAAIWNNTGDAATLRNQKTQVVDTCVYSGGGVSTVCGN